MKKLLILICVYAVLLPCRTNAQSFEAHQLLLDVEKLSTLKNILKDLEEGYTIVSKGYTTIRDISSGNFNLHKLFLDGLLQVSPAVRKYQKIAAIISLQGRLVKEYKTAFNRFKTSDLFNPSELAYMGRVYDNLFDRSVQNLDELVLIVTAGKLRMSDDERLAATDRIYQDITDKLSFLRSFNHENSLLVIQRGREMVDTKISKKLNGL